MTELNGFGQTPSPSVEADTFRQVMSVVCSQVVVATTLTSGRPHGTTVTAFLSVSLDPPLVAVSLSRDSVLLARLRHSGLLGVNVLAHEQHSVAARCSGKEDGKFDEVRWTESAGVPRIVGTAGWLACEVWDEIAVGDHVLVIGHVVAASSAEKTTAPLVYAQRTFGTHSQWAPLERSA